MNNTIVIAMFLLLLVLIVVLNNRVEKLTKDCKKANQILDDHSGLIGMIKDWNGTINNQLENLHYGFALLEKTKMSKKNAKKIAEEFIKEWNTPISSYKEENDD